MTSPPIAHPQNEPLGKPVCFVKQKGDKLAVDLEAAQILEAFEAPLAIISVAGMYRTGKSFLLNQLAGVRGFSVGSTTESCTRGIWLWQVPPEKATSASGARILLLDTEGMASMDQDENYDSKIFSLGLLLCSLFVLNSMGVIDESAIDRLYLVSELTKYICGNVDTKEAVKALRAGQEEDEVKEAQLEKELASYFPPFIWLLRDFVLELKSQGKDLSTSEYLESALQTRDGQSKRNEERNRIRASIRTLFRDRDCRTLVRPAIDESVMRDAVGLSPEDLRPEFRIQMEALRSELFAKVRPKKMFGKELDGKMLVMLAKTYVDAMNSGDVPSIKGAWEFVAEATCKSAAENALSLYTTAIRGIALADPPAEQKQFEDEHQRLEDQAMQLYNTKSVAGPSREATFLFLKSEIAKEKALQLSLLQARSKEVCLEARRRLIEQCITQPMEAVPWTSVDQFREGFSDFLAKYEQQASGPAKKPALLACLTQDIVPQVKTLLATVTRIAEKQREKLQAEHIEKVKEMEHKERELEQNLMKANMSAEKQVYAIENLQKELQQKQQTIQAAGESIKKLEENSSELDSECRQQRKRIEELLEEVHNESRRNDSLSSQLKESQSKLQQKEGELLNTSEKLSKNIEDLKSNLKNEQLAHQKSQQDFEQQRKGLEASITRFQAQMDQVAAQLTAATSARDSGLQMLEEKETRIAEIETALADAEEFIEELNRQHDETSSQLKSLESAHEEKLSVLEGRIKRQQKQLGETADTMEIMKCLSDLVWTVDCAQMAQQIQLLTEEKDALKEKLDDFFVKVWQTRNSCFRY